jgi:hypothetical protein
MASKGDGWQEFGLSFLLLSLFKNFNQKWSSRIKSRLNEEDPNWELDCIKRI